MLSLSRDRALRALLFSLVLPLGCSSDKPEGSDPLENRGDGGGSKSDAGTGKDSGQTTKKDASSNTRDSSSKTDPESDSGACSVARGDGIAKTLPVDIVWVIDDSFSMLDDTVRVQQNLATFAKSLVEAGVEDYHIIMLNEPTAVLAPPWDPQALGVDPARFFAYPIVAFNDCFSPALVSFQQWSGNLRPDAALHFVMVTDDNSLISWPDFKSQMDMNLNGKEYTVHAIVDPPQHCLGSTRPGTAYWEAAAATGGQQRSICESDWSPTFKAIEDSIKTTAQVPCQYTIPDPGDGQVYDRSQVNVQHVLDGTSTPYKRKSSMDDCGTEQGWYYDDPANPTQVLLCPASCEEVDQQGGSINIDFVCDGRVFL